MTKPKKTESGDPRQPETKPVTSHPVRVASVALAVRRVSPMPPEGYFPLPGALAHALFVESGKSTRKTGTVLHGAVRVLACVRARRNRMV